VVVFRRTVLLTVGSEEKSLPIPGLFYAIVSLIAVFALEKKKKDL
jgi:hypothetical protein